MFKDQKKELQRLEEELLKDQEAYEPAMPEEFEEDLTEEFAEYSAQEVDGWNADVTDTDLEDFSDQVYEAPKKSSVNLLSIAAALLLLAAALGWLVMKKRGMLP